MRAGKFFRKLGPVLGLAMGVALAGCDSNMDMKFNGEEGVPLAELDMSGAAPTTLAIAGPDLVRITEGDTLAITVEGDTEATDTLRFVLKDGTLGIAREDGWKGGGIATVNVTMPAPSEIAIGASGSVETPTMAKDASIAIGGSGSVNIATLDADELSIAIGGSGKVMASGKATKLSLSVGGSGDLVAPDLQVQEADINIGGSGNAEFASDGTVNASIAGAGDIVVHGSAKCELSSFGSGKLTCQPRSNAAPAAQPAEAAEAPEGPDAPDMPDAPEAPDAPTAG
ncbi:head GIN domain-containing protein [Paraurantiacibacter namhicola]|uniref:Putative auto-transporter adhesin head GIN domain-containing protein n=1 Tax=Paraurantiacibacter namhicola TaxID=645517 RepID=A0A1C7D5Z7_9SPHN|nr:head GIN domain-containing protein [Paraurantiacibacter namhicola]ANU06733.1 hypothetical protein A6F65_00408 [Paraurantiacibacter namhicola]